MAGIVRVDELRFAFKHYCRCGCREAALPERLAPAAPRGLPARHVRALPALLRRACRRLLRHCRDCCPAARPRRHCGRQPALLRAGRGVTGPARRGWWRARPPGLEPLRWPAPRLEDVPQQRRYRRYGRPPLRRQWRGRQPAGAGLAATWERQRGAPPRQQGRRARRRRSLPARQQQRPWRKCLPRRCRPDRCRCPPPDLALGRRQCRLRLRR